MDEGTNTLVGTEPTNIYWHVAEILKGNPKKGRVPELWDGKAAERIADVLVREFDVAK